MSFTGVAARLGSRCSSPVLHTTSPSFCHRPDHPYTPRAFEYQSTRQGSNGITTPSYPLSQAPYTLYAHSFTMSLLRRGTIIIAMTEISAVPLAGDFCLLYPDGMMLPVSIGSDVCRNMFASFKYGG